MDLAFIKEFKKLSLLIDMDSVIIPFLSLKKVYEGGGELSLLLVW
jgi:hypothetical protein